MSFGNNPNFDQSREILPSQNAKIEVIGVGGGGSNAVNRMINSDLEGVGRFFIHMTADTMSNEDVSTSILNAYKEIDASYITIEGLATQSNETKVSLYNILGREVLSTTLNNNMGTQTISTVGLSAGIYVIELESGSDRLTKKLLIQ